MFPPYGGLGPYGVYGNLGLFGALVAYGSLNYTETSPSQTFVEPMTTDEVRRYLRLPIYSPVDPDEDTDLQGYIIAAREQAEIFQNRDLVQKQWDMALDYWPSYRVEMRDPLVSVDLVQYKDSDGVIWPMSENVASPPDNTDDIDMQYVVDTQSHPGKIIPPYNQTWPTFAPWPSSAILVRFTSGFAPGSWFWNDAGQRVKMGMKMLISAWYNNRLPFERGIGPSSEYPFAVTSCLSHGALVRAR